MVMRVINNGFESFRETVHRVIIRDMRRTVYSRRVRGEHVEFIVFYLFGEVKENKTTRFFVITEADFHTAKKEKKVA